MSIKISSRKAKGRFLQNHVAKRLSEIFEVNFNNQDDHSDIKTRTMGCSGTDIIIQNKEVYNQFKFDVECKAVEKFNLYEAIKQAKLNTKEMRNWLVIHKRKNDKPIAILDFEVFLNLIKKGVY
jgi:hypothetical protein